MNLVDKNLEKSTYVIEIPTALNPETIFALHQQWERINIACTRFILLKSQSKNIFCRGMDIRWVSQNNNNSFFEATKNFVSFLENLQNCPYITISIIDGLTEGGGVGIVSASDIVLATDQSSFQLTEGLFGLVPGIILPSLLSRLSPQTIKKMVFSAKKLSAQEAHNIGLVDEVTPAEDLETCLHCWIHQLKRCKRQSVIDLKFLLEKNKNPNHNLSQLGISLLQKRLMDKETMERLKNLAYYLETN